MSGRTRIFLERPRKEKLGSSNLVYEEDGEMRGEGGSEDMAEQHYLRGGRSHWSKLNGKAFNHSDAVGSAAVPRKLRSVIVKRNRETISSPLLESKRLCHISTHLGEYSTCHGPKQGSKLGTANRPPKLLTPFFVTKDEEEVAEALFAIARIIPADINPKRKGDQKVHVAESEIRPGNKSSLPLEGSFPLNKTHSNYAIPSAFRLFLGAIIFISFLYALFSSDSTAIKEECTILENSVTAEHSKITTSKEESPGLSVKLEPAIDSSFLKEQNFPASGSFQLDQEKVSISPINKSRKDENNKIESVDLLNPIWPLCTLPIGKRSPPQTLMNVPDSLKGVNGIELQDDVQTKSNGHNSMDIVSVSNALPCKLQGGYGIETRSLMKANSRASPVSLNCSADLVTGESLKKKLHIGSLEVNQSWKRCATHLCIAELIQRHKGLGKNRFLLPIQPEEIKHNEGSVSSATTLNNEVPDLNSYLDNTNLGESYLATKRSSHVSIKSLFQDRKLLTDQFPLQKSGLSRHQNQGFNFLSLATGGCLTKNIMQEHNPDNLVGLSLKKLSSCSQSLQLHSDVMSAPQTRFSAGYSDQMATATSQQVHLQQFLLNQYLGCVSKQQSMQQQQQWGSQLGQYGSSNILSPLKWQNGLQSDPSFLISNSALASLQSSVLEPFGVMFPAQHQLHTNVSSFPQSGDVDEIGRVVLQQMLCNVQR